MFFDPVYRGVTYASTVKQTQALIEQAKEYQIKLESPVVVEKFSDVTNVFGDRVPTPPIYLQNEEFVYSGMGSVCRKLVGVHQLANEDESVTEKEVTRTFFTCGTRFLKFTSEQQLICMHYVSLKETVIRPSWSKWYLDFLESQYPMIYHMFQDLLSTYKVGTGKRVNLNSTASIRSMSDPEEVAVLVICAMFPKSDALVTIDRFNHITSADIRALIGYGK